ncbi:CBU_0592 family membrane protein [Aeromicrobium alkaliterrae]|uniref:CBU-0592-like domain-containing protein n=1 Tax=Aeromicrobium alkaliterrae TaxID=302168 RepID=A0ABN2K707_9ACTN
MIAGMLGWLGAGGTFVAYVLVARGRLSVDSWRYAALNAVGGTMGCLASAVYGAWGSAFSNAVWAAVGLHALVTIAAARRRQREVPVTVESQDSVALCS